MNQFIGPFEYEHGGIKRINDVLSREWRMLYARQELAVKVLPTQNTVLSELQEAFFDARASFVRNAQKKHGPQRIDLVDSETGDPISDFYSYDMCEMSPGLINDMSRYWIRSENRKYSRAITLSDWGRIIAEHEAPQNAWISGLLSDEVLTTNSENWRPPSAWEIRHIVGEGSFTGISGAKAAALVGVTPQNFRKYTARDGAKGQQNISYSMWHLLLHKLGVQTL